MSLYQFFYFVSFSLQPIDRSRAARSTNFRSLAGMDVDDDGEDDDADDDDEEEEEPEDPECIVCGGDEGLARCSTCPSAFHYDCHNPPLRHAPRSSWRCQQCTSGIRIRKKSSRNTVTSSRSRASTSRLRRSATSASRSSATGRNRSSSRPRRNVSSTRE